MGVGISFIHSCLPILKGFISKPQCDICLYFLKLIIHLNFHHYDLSVLLTIFDFFFQMLFIVYVYCGS